MSHEVFGDNDGDGHDDCFTEEHVNEAVADERDRIIALGRAFIERKHRMGTAFSTALLSNFLDELEAEKSK
jgi:hypothetical protein